MNGERASVRSRAVKAAPIAPPLTSLHQRTIALLQRPERLLGRNGRADLVQIPRSLRLCWLLHLDQVRGMDLAAVRANRALAEERVVGRHLLHLLDDLGAVVALDRFDRL